MTEDTSGTCDWGSCDGETIAERFAPELNEWLGVCVQHGERPPRPPSKRGTCSGCGTEYALSTVGLVRAHNHGFAVRCPGTGAKPVGVAS